MRRTSSLALAAALAVLLLALPLGASAAQADAPTALVLAAAAGEEPLGPDPQPRTAEGNAATELAGYEDREVPFTWGIAWILSVAGILGVAALALFYRFRVARG